MAVSPLVQTAVDAFETRERRRLSADKADQELATAVSRLANRGTQADRADYLRLTQQIIANYERKRGKAGL